jgi:hypothetical protein
MTEQVIISVVSARRASRHETWLKGYLHIGRRRFRVTVRNLSAHGAKVQGSMLPQPGEVVELAVGEFKVSATVVWEREWNRGVHFHEPVSARGIIEENS